MWPYPAHYAELEISSDRDRSRYAAHRYALLQAIREQRQRRRSERTRQERGRRPTAVIHALLRG